MRIGTVMNFAVLSHGRPVGTLRFGFVDCRSVHAAACRECGQSRYEDELEGPEEAAIWIMRHLERVHAVGVDGLSGRGAENAVIRRSTVRAAMAVGEAWGMPRVELKALPQKEVL